MKTETAIEFFGGSRRKLAEALGVSVQAVGQWGELVPELQAARLEKKTYGKLKYRMKPYKD